MDKRQPDKSDFREPAPPGQAGSINRWNKKFVAAGPVSRIRRAAMKTDNLFKISRREVSTMSTLSVLAGLASHRRHNGRSETIVC